MGLAKRTRVKQGSLPNPELAATSSEPAHGPNQITQNTSIAQFHCVLSSQNFEASCSVYHLDLTDALAVNKHLHWPGIELADREVEITLALQSHRYTTWRFFVASHYDSSVCLQKYFPIARNLRLAGSSGYAVGMILPGEALQPAFRART